MNKLRTLAKQRLVQFAHLCTAFSLLVAMSPAHAQGSGDERENFFVRPFVGLGIDSFAAGNVSQYLNQGESGDIEERFTAGIEFSYRLKGKPSDEQQLWVWGRTTHGVRSTDVDCRENAMNPLCTPFSTELQDPTNRGLFILRNASSLEGIGGFRWEFKRLPLGGEGGFGARAYVSTQFGFVAVADGPDDVAGIHHVGVGAMVTEGEYKRSYLELGYGTNDLILENQDERLKLNARVVKRLADWVGAFAHITVDVDAGDGSDSIQTYLGLYFTIGGGS
ncbi:MAG: hypothetical protein AAF417_18205 [Pseudomonadota bacterium]